MSGTMPEQDPWDAVPGQQGTQPGGPGPVPGYGGAQWQGGAPGYGYPPPGTPPYYYVARRRTNGLAIASLVCGICGFLYLIPAILGIVFGAVAVRQIKRDGSEGRGMAIAGIACGAAWLALVLVLVLIIIGANN